MVVRKNHVKKRARSSSSAILRDIAFIGSYTPRRCGIATFTADLLNATKKEAPNAQVWAIATNDIDEGYDYSDDVRFEIAQNSIKEYQLAANFLNMHRVDAVCLQHEYGIYGGDDGKFVLELLSWLNVPAVTTLHTILAQPNDNQREVMKGLVSYSDRLVVMSKKGRRLLQDVYGVPRRKIVHIPHGIPDVAFIDPNYYKEQFGVEGKQVILTFGLLSPNKGIEYMIEALPEIVATHPEVVYIVLGATHPNVKKNSGEDYRIALKMRARELGVEQHVIFHDRFVSLDELCEFLGAAAIYVTPYLNQEQITSGTLAYAIGTGNATVSTRYWHAEELLDSGRGRLVPFSDSRSLADNIIELLDRPSDLHRMRKSAYEFSRGMVWPKVAAKYLQLFQQIKLDRQKKPRPSFHPSQYISSATELPEIKLDHLRTMTDDTGMLQHAIFNVPRREDGYCTDDNARALIVTTLAQELLLDNRELEELSNRYLSFVYHAYDSETKCFRNFMSFDRRWTEEKGSEDSHGRAIWCLGAAINRSKSEKQICMAMELFKGALTTAEALKAPRAMAFAIIGIEEYLHRFGGDLEARHVAEHVAAKLFKHWQQKQSKKWPWIDDKLTYANGKIAQGLLVAGRLLNNQEATDSGLRVLDWLIDVQMDEKGYFVPIGNQGWFPKKGSRARFDQQPIEAQAMIEACIEAYQVTNDMKRSEQAMIIFEWFLGRNDLKTAAYDFSSGGCHDGLQPEGVNQNQGAESTLAWLMSLIDMYFLTASVDEASAIHKLNNHRNQQRALRDEVSKERALGGQKL